MPSMNNLHIVKEPNLAANCAVSIAQYVADVTAEGWVVHEHTLLPTDNFFVALSLISGADHVQLFGHCPIVLLYFDPDGHGIRDGECDAPYCANNIALWNWNGTHFDPLGVWPEVPARTCGRVDFSGLSSYSASTEYQLFDAYMARNHAARTGGYTYTNRGFVNNHLEYLDPGLTAACIAKLEQNVGVGAVTDLTNAYTSDLFYRTYTPQSWVVGTLYSGGDPFAPLGHEYGIGIAQDVVDYPVNILHAWHFCSGAWAFNGWPLQRLALAGGCQTCLVGACAYCPDWSPPSISTWSTTVPLQAAIKPTYVQGSPYVFTIQGDGTMRAQSAMSPPPPPPPPLGLWEQLTNDCYNPRVRTVIPY